MFQWTNIQMFVCAWAADPHFTHLHLPRAERLMSIGWSGARIKTQRASSLYVEWQGTEPKSSHLTPLRQGVLVRRATWLGSNSTRGFLRGLGSQSFLESGSTWWENQNLPGFWPYICLALGLHRLAQDVARWFFTQVCHGSKFNNQLRKFSQIGVR